MADYSDLPDLTQFSDCDLTTCPLWTSFYNYRIDLASNTVFVALFTAALVYFLAVYIATRRAFWFTLGMSLGLMAEIAGYAARIASWTDQWDMNAFLAQIICITVGPAFFSAAVYFCLERVVSVYGEGNSRVPRGWYMPTFITGDIVSLLLQMAGGIVAAIALINDDDDSITTGDNIMIAGLSTQVFSLFVFIVICVDLALRTRRRVKKFGPEITMNQEPAMIQTRRSKKFKGFLVAQALATVLIFWRSCYRVAELNDGWSGPVTFNQGLFIGMEPVLMTVAVFALGAFHPAFCMPAAFTKLSRGESEEKA